MRDENDTVGRLLAPGDVAELFGVSRKTVGRWADAGKLRAIRTLGGHRRFDAEEVREQLARRGSPDR